MRYAFLVLALATATATAFAQQPAADVVLRARRAVVHVESVDRNLLKARQLRREGRPVQVWGHLLIQQPYTLLVSGVVISEDGKIVTPALHPRADLQVTVTFHDGTRKTATILGTDALSNLALLKVGRNTGPDHLSLQELAPRQRDTLHVVGHRLIGTPHPVTLTGHVGQEALSIQLQDSYRVTEHTKGRIHIGSAFALYTPHANPLAGSACVDARGRLTGVIVGSMPPTGRVQIQFGTPATRVARIVRDLEKHGRVIRAWFGCIFRSVPKALRAHFKELPSAACAITDVLPDTPAARAGLRVHDVILSLDGRHYRDGVELGEAMADKTPGTPVAFQLLRRGEEITVRAVPTERR